MKIIVENIHSKLVSDNPDSEFVKLKGILAKKYSAKLPGSEYSSAYKLKHWDGVKHYFSKATGKFGTGLLYSIRSDLDYVGYDYEVIDNREALPLESIDIKGVEYREYQRVLIEKALEARGAIIKAPTGAGKTIVLAGMVKALSRYTGLIFFTKKQLLYQTYKKLTEFGLDVGVCFGDGVEIKPITLCTLQSVDKIIDSHLGCDFIIFDEVHEFSKGKLATKVVKSFPQASYRIGMTATVPTEKVAKLNIISWLGEILTESDLTELIKEGFLSQAEIIILKTKEENFQKCIDMTYPEIYDEYITTNSFRNDAIAKICKKVGEKKSKTLVIVKTLEHAKILQELIPGSYKLEGKDNLLERDKVIQKFKDEDSSVIIGTTIFQTGIDIPEITHFINARGLKSEIATLQAMGRALRVHKSKESVFIYDFEDNAPYLDKHATERIKVYKATGLKVNHGTHRPKTKKDK